MPKQSKLTGADYLLLLLYMDNCSPINGAIRVTKMMFLFNKEIAPLLRKAGAKINDDDLPDFLAYNYGPFSKAFSSQSSTSSISSLAYKFLDFTNPIL